MRQDSFCVVSVVGKANDVCRFQQLVVFVVLRTNEENIFSLHRKVYSFWPLLQTLLQVFDFDGRVEMHPSIYSCSKAIAAQGPGFKGAGRNLHCPCLSSG